MAWLLSKYLILCAISWQASCVPVALCPSGQYYDPSGDCIKCPDSGQPLEFLKAAARAHPECRPATTAEVPATSTTNSTGAQRRQGARHGPASGEADKNVGADVSTASDGDAALPTEQGTEPPRGASINWLLALAMCGGAALAIGAAAAVIYACCPSLRSRVMGKIRYLLGRQATSDINLQTPEAETLMSPTSDSNQTPETQTLMSPASDTNQAPEAQTLMSPTSDSSLPNPTLPIKPEPSMTGPSMNPVPTIPRVDTA